MEKVTITISVDAARDLWEELTTGDWDASDLSGHEGRAFVSAELWETTHHELVEELGKAFGGEHG